MKRFSLIALLVGLVLTAGCSMDSEQGILMAAGSYSDLAVVVSDPRSEPMARRFIDQVNRTRTFVIKEETQFNGETFLPDVLDRVQRYKNVLLVLRVGDGGPVEKEVKSMVSKETWARLSQGSGGLVQLNDPWATYQTVLVVAGRDRNSLGSFLRNEADQIRDILASSNRDRILRRYRYTGLDTRLMNAYRDQFGFTLEIPKEFKQNQLRPKGYQGLELLQAAPSRGISISWLPHENPEAALRDQDFLLAMRQEMGLKMHSEEIVPSSFVWSETTLGDNPAIMMEGAWTSTRFAGGGPYWCYFLADRASGRVVCIDLLTYAPGMDKWPFLRKLEAIASTFKFVR